MWPPTWASKGPLGAGYQRVLYTVRLKTKAGATADQIAELRTGLQASPVGDTFEQHVPVSFELEVS